MTTSPLDGVPQMGTGYTLVDEWEPGDPLWERPNRGQSESSQVIRNLFQVLDEDGQKAKFIRQSHHGGTRWWCHRCDVGGQRNVPNAYSPRVCCWNCGRSIP